MAAAVRRRALAGVHLPLLSADMFGVILDISADTAAAGADSIDARDGSEEAEATVRGRLRPGDGGQIIPSCRMTFVLGNDRRQCWLAVRRGEVHAQTRIMGK